MPSMFVSHGSPMVVLETGPYQQALAAFGKRTRPAAIVVISAHWGTTTEVEIASAERHHLIYDFGGFPPALYRLQYNVTGAPELAERIAQQLQPGRWQAHLNPARGLDHGVWVPLRLMYPGADIPTVEVSVPLSLSPEQLFSLGQCLAPLTGEGVLILGSGGIVHNLFLFRGGPREQRPEPWAVEFDTWFKISLESGDIGGLLQYSQRAPHARLAVPTFEHFAPVFVTLGAAHRPATVEHIYEGFEYGHLSMRSFALA